MISFSTRKKLMDIICSLHYLAEIEYAPNLDGLAYDLEIEYMNLIND